MIIDGVAASEAIDSSGEILDVKGCDISDLEEGRGVLNFEHKGESDAGASFNDIIGRITFAKKIYTESDCKNERERFYWNEVKLPFIYIQCELFDQDGHKGAESAAGMIRHYHKRGLPILVRYSIEGVTIQKEGNRLSKCIAKRVAATIKPCNKSCHSGVLEDPKEGFEAKLDETPDPIGDLVDKADAKKFEHPEYTKLGGVHEIELATPELEKTLTAGNYNVAPGSLEGGAALQVSDINQRHNFLKAQALAAYRDWDKQTDFRSFIKMRLLDVDPAFIDHFVNLVEDYHKIKLKKADSDPLDAHEPLFHGTNAVLKPGDHILPGRKVGKVVEEMGDDSHNFVWLTRDLNSAKHYAATAAAVNGGAPRVYEVRHSFDIYPSTSERKVKDFTTGRSVVHREIPWTEPSADDEFEKAEQTEMHFEEPPTSIRPKYPDDTPKLPKTRKPELKRERKNGLRLTPNGTFITQKHSLKMHLPEIAGSDSPYFQILYPTKARHLPDEKKIDYLEKVHKPWLRAMQHWMPLNDMLRAGKLPESVVYHAAMFSAMSPNTSVPMQELYYGHIMDLMHHHGFDPRDPVHDHHLQYLKDMIAGGRLPEWNRDMYEEKGHTEGSGKKASAGDPPQILGFQNYHAFHPYMMDLVNQHRDDGQQIAATLMHMKNLGQRANKHRKTVDHPTVTGFGIKLARYTLGMMGAGNVLVPDRHFMRAMFNINPRTGGHILSHLTNVFEESTAEKAMRGLDQFFFEHHPAAQYVISRFPEHFKGREQQAIFPAFWLHWLATPHYEEAQGMSNDNAQNAGTDHMPYWHSIQPEVEKVMRKYHVNFNESDETAFDFGHNAIQKSETIVAPVASRTAHAMKEIEERFGESAAHFAFHAYMVPVLMQANHNLKKPDLHCAIMKAQELTINLSKALADFKSATPRGIYKLYDESDGTSRMVARFAVHNDQIQILEDNGALKGYFEDGIITQRVQDAIQKLKSTPNMKLVTVAEENADKYDSRSVDAMPDVPDRAKAYYEFRIRGLSTKHILEVEGNHVRFDDRHLTEDEIHEIMDEVKSGVASLRLMPAPNMLLTQIAKAEEAMVEIVALEKSEPIDKHPNGLGNLYAWAMFKEDLPEDGVYVELDANDFTWVNNVHGFEVGDKAINALGTAVQETASDVGKKSKAFRGEGDSFYVWFKSKEDAHLFCRKLRTNLEQIPSIGGTHNLTVCIGLGITPEDAKKAQAKAKNAKYAGGFKPGQAEQYVYSLLPDSIGLVPFEDLPPLKKPAP